MRRTLILGLLIFLLIVFLYACGGGQSTSSATTTTTLPEPDITVEQQELTTTKIETTEVLVTIGSSSEVVTQEVVNDVVVVNLATGASESSLTTQLAALGYSIVGQNSETNTYQVSLPSGKSLSQAIADTTALSAVENSGTDPITRKEITVPDETIFTDSGEFLKVWGFDQNFMERVWDLTQGSSTLRIAVIDSGIDVDHPEFDSDRLIYKKNFVANNANPNDDEEEAHGTAVSGIIAAEGDNSQFMAGMNWNSKIIPLKVLNDKGAGSSFTVCNAISYAIAAGAKVINYSGGVWCNSWSNSAVISAFQKAADECADNNVLLVCSAGNDNSNVEATLSTHYPGGGLSDYANVITVAAVDRNGDMASFTNYGNAVTIAAPGQAIYSTINRTEGGALESQNGTSFAAPFVTGLVSLIWSINPDLTPAGVKTCLIDGADEISNDKNIGYKINAWGAIKKALYYKNRGIIAVESNPASAAIYVDGSYAGRVTRSDGYIYLEATPGSHTVKVMASSSNISQEAVTVTKGSVSYVSFVLSGATLTTTTTTTSTSTTITSTTTVTTSTTTTTTSTTLTTTTTTTSTTTTTGIYTLEIVDQASSDTGRHTSIGLDSNNKAHISYYDYSNSNLKYATNKTGSWVAEAIDSSGTVGQYSSIAIDSNDKVHISYVDITNHRLKYTTNSSGSWLISTLDSGTWVGWETSIAIDSNNKVHISYYEGNPNYNLKYTTNAPSGSWSNETVDNSSGTVGLYSAIAIDSNNKVHISYYDTGNTNLKYASGEAGSWLRLTLDNTAVVGQFTSIAIESQDTVVITYYDATNYNLKYATNGPGYWIRGAIDETGDVGKYSALAIDSSDDLHIAYYDNTNGNLKYITQTTGTWVDSVIQSTGSVGEYCGLALDSSGKPHFSYYDASNTNLKHAKQN